MTTGGKEGQPDRNSPEFIQRVKDRAFYRSQRKAADVGTPRDADYVQAEEEQLLKAEIVGEVRAQVDQGVAYAHTAATESGKSADLAKAYQDAASKAEVGTGLDAKKSAEEADRAEQAAKDSLFWTRQSAGRADTSRRNASKSEDAATRAEQAANRELSESEWQEKLFHLGSNRTTDEIEKGLREVEERLGNRIADIEAKVSPQAPKGDDDKSKEPEVREKSEWRKKDEEWTRRWDMAFSEAPAKKADEQTVPQAETVVPEPELETPSQEADTYVFKRPVERAIEEKKLDRTWINKDDRQVLLRSLEPQNVETYNQRQLKSESVRKATERLERTNKEREERLQKEVTESVAKQFAESEEEAKAEEPTHDVALEAPRRAIPLPAGEPLTPKPPAESDSAPAEIPSAGEKPVVSEAQPAPASPPVTEPPAAEKPETGETTFEPDAEKTTAEEEAGPAAPAVPTEVPEVQEPTMPGQETQTAGPEIPEVQPTAPTPIITPERPVTPAGPERPAEPPKSEPTPAVLPPEMEELLKKAEEEEQKRKQELEQVKKEGREAGLNEGKILGKEELWKELSRKRPLKERLKILFSRHPTESGETDAATVNRYKRDIYRTFALAGVGGALGMLTIWAIAQRFGIFLPIPVTDLFVRAKEIIHHIK